MKKNARLTAIFACSALIAAPAMADPASQLTRINGMGAGAAEDMLHDRGFKHISSHNSMGYTYSYWWDKEDRSCVNVEAQNGMVLTVNDTQASDCGHTKDGSGGAVAGAIVGAAIIGALASHKSHHHEDKKHYGSVEDEAHYERGYTDGLHNAAYHNYDRSNAYSNGYAAGVGQRAANLTHHQGRGGYTRSARYNDLNGARASSADGQLSSRGFRNVDGFKSGSTAYTIWYSRATRQCVQMTVADGRVYDIRDIGRHPNCR